MDEKKFCAHCGHELEEGAVYCPNCGERVGSEVNGTYESSSSSSNASYSNHYSETKSSQSTDYSMLTLVFGVLSIVLGGLIWAILALVFASKADKADTKTKVGKTLAILGIVLWSIIIVILMIVYISAFLGAAGY